MKKKFNYVYITTNLLNGKQYVEDHSADNLNDSYLGSGRPHFERAKKKYGRENFKKQILKQFNTKKEAFDAQEKYINKYNTLSPNGYNISPKGGNGVRGCWNKESLKKLSESHKGKKLSEEHKKKISKSNKKRIVSEETKKKISKSHKGKKLSEEHKKKISKSHKGKITWMKGKKHSNEAKYKNKIAHIGRKDSIETKKKKSNAMLGKKNPLFGKFNKNHPGFGTKRKRIICEYCKKNIAINVYTRYHGEKCKNK